jgi:DNA-binding FrmR family transcriptional regulator
MKRQEKFGIAFWIFVLAMMLLGLCGCSKTEPEVLMSETIKQDVEVMTAQVDAVKQTLAKECKTPAVLAQLSAIEKNIKTLSAKADAEVAVCEKSKEVYTQQISKLRVIIFGLIIACGLLVFVIIKRKSIL